MNNILTGIRMTGKLVLVLIILGSNPAEAMLRRVMRSLARKKVLSKIVKVQKSVQKRLFHKTNTGNFYGLPGPMYPFLPIDDDSDDKTDDYMPDMTIAQQIIEHLKIMNITFNKTTKKGNTLLHLAAKRGQKDILFAYLETSAYAHINKQNVAGNTPLHIAAQNAHTDCVKVLIEANAQRHIRNKKGKIPYDYVKDEKFWWRIKDLLKPTP